MNNHNVELQNLSHAIANTCTDPDCEIHNPSVAIAEEVVSPTNLAFYVAGVYRGIEIAQNAMDNVTADARDELVNDGIYGMIPPANPTELEVKP